MFVLSIPDKCNYFSVEKNACLSYFVFNVVYYFCREKTNIQTMRGKAKRILSIRKLISSELISSQEELLLRLREMGVVATQSTLSRDLNFLKAVKVPHKEKGYLYMLPEDVKSKPEEKTSSVITDAILRIEFSGNIAVIKTLPGYANAVTVLIDNENIFEILGTIAGEDTIAIIMREGVTQSQMLEALTSIHPDIHQLCRC